MNKKASAKIFLIIAVVLVLALLTAISFLMFTSFTETSSVNSTSYESLNDTIGVIDIGTTFLSVIVPLSIILVILGIVIGVGVILFKMVK